jgi:hypothetical protein
MKVTDDFGKGGLKIVKVADYNKKTMEDEELETINMKNSLEECCYK